MRPETLRPFRALVKWLFIISAHWHLQCKHTSVNSTDIYNCLSVLPVQCLLHCISQDAELPRLLTNNYTGKCTQNHPFTIDILQSLEQCSIPLHVLTQSIQVERNSSRKSLPYTVQDLRSFPGSPQRAYGRADSDGFSI